MIREKGGPGSDSGASTSIASPPRSGLTRILARDATVVSLELDARRRAARDRLKWQADHRRVCAALHRLAPLTVYYRRRR
jgi:hypothetical protein